jgi:hypothetical protein
MMTEKQRDEIKRLRHEANAPDNSGELLTHEGAKHFIDNSKNQKVDRNKCRDGKRSGQSGAAMVWLNQSNKRPPEFQGPFIPPRGNDGGSRRRDPNAVRLPLVPESFSAV